MIEKKKKIKTEDLVKIIKSVKRKKFTKIDSSTKVFQSLRIFVNKEISELIKGLINAYNLLPKGGIIVVITFHSIEDRIVKFFFKNLSEKKSISRYMPENNEKENLLLWKNKKPILPSVKEIKTNPPNPSAVQNPPHVSSSKIFKLQVFKLQYLQTPELSNSECSNSTYSNSQF